MEENLIGLFSTAPILISFLAGILTFISPCILPLIPIYISYVSKLSISELQNKANISLMTRLTILRSSVFFLLGLGVVFVLIGSVSARILGGGILLSPYMGYFAGIVLVIFGLNAIGIIRIPFLNYQKTISIDRFVSFSFMKDFFTPFILGVSFSLGWTPCVGPILAGIISLASLEADRGIILMIVYVLGLSVPFLLCSFLLGFVFNVLNKIKSYFRIIELVAGFFLISIGILVAFGGISKISSFIMG